MMVGVFALAEKGGYAIAPLLAGLFLGMVGFIESDSGIVEQPDEVLFAARVAMSIIPAVIGSIAMLTLMLYRLPEELARR